MATLEFGVLHQTTKVDKRVERVSHEVARFSNSGKKFFPLLLALIGECSLSSGDGNCKC